MRPLQAHCHLGLGILYAKTCQQEQAHTELAAATDLYRAMDMSGTGTGGRSERGKKGWYPHPMIQGMAGKPYTKGARRGRYAWLFSPCRASMLSTFPQDSLRSALVPSDREVRVDRSCVENGAWA
jgi:hypothetical protein